MRLTQERLKNLLAYDPKSGKFFRRTSRGGFEVGTEMGCGSNGYVLIRVDRRLYRAHRLAWLYVHGYFPEHGLDHIDRDTTNNRIDNLREVSQVCNLRNCGNRVNNTTGVKGVHWHKQIGKWRAVIAIPGRQPSLGVYNDFVDAVCARLAAEQCLGWEGCDSSSPAYRYVKGLPID